MITYGNQSENMKLKFKFLYKYQIYGYRCRVKEINQKVMNNDICRYGNEKFMKQRKIQISLKRENTTMT